MIKTKEGAFGWRTLLEKLKALFNDREARELWKWHQQQEKQPGEPDFATHPHAVASQHHRGTIRGNTIAEHAREIRANHMATLQHIVSYIERHITDKKDRASIFAAALAMVADKHMNPNPKDAAIQILAGWHGNGHLLRQRSLQMDGWQYAEVVNKVQQIQGRT